jgi:asparagine synthase (glutamine-hydrolysing)
MCGIVGIIGFKASDKVGLIEKSLELLKHRGPDEHGVAMSNNWIMGHTRLSIVDLITGQQPLKISSITLVFNGEIYNYKKLREILQGLGYNFLTESDTEVILVSYLHWGESCVSLLEGMFAFALIDESKNKFLIARDKVGQKPLVILKKANLLYFSSEISSLGFRSNYLEGKVLGEYYEQGFVTSMSSLYDGYLGCDPGTYVVGDLINFSHKSTKYWCPVDIFINKKKTKYNLRSCIRNAIVSHTNADVDIGLLLSGGLDSGIIASDLAKINTKFTSITIGAEYNSEVVKAKKLLRRVKFKYNHLVIEPKTFESVNLTLDKIVNSANSPFSDIATLFSFLISRSVSNLGIKVALTGDGADEVFMGYSRYTVLFWAYQLRGIKYLLKHFIFLKSIRLLLSVIDNPEIHIFGSNGFNRDLITNKEYEYPEIMNLKTDWAKKAQLFDIKYRLPYYYLQKVDISSSLNSVEYRAPYLDEKLVEIGITTPTSQLIPFGISKFKLKLIARSFQFRKRGFDADFPESLKNELGNVLSIKGIHNKTIQQLWNLVILKKWH